MLVDDCGRVLSVRITASVDRRTVFSGAGERIKCISTGRVKSLVSEARFTQLSSDNA